MLEILDICLTIGISFGYFCRLAVQFAWEKMCCRDYTKTKLPDFTGLVENKLSWEALRSEMKWNKCWAIVWSILYILFFHLSQPIFFFISLYYYWGDLSSEQLIFSQFLAFREAVYFLLTLATAYKCPVFVFVKVFSGNDADDFYFYFFHPEKVMIVLLSELCNCGGVVGIYLILIVICDVFALVAITHGCFYSHALDDVMPFLVFYSVVAIGNIPAYLLVVCCAIPAILLAPLGCIEKQEEQRPFSGITRQYSILSNNSIGINNLKPRTYFISHKQDESGAIANDLWHSLGRNEAVWLDVKNPTGQSIKDMKAGIAECPIFICLLSRSYMSSKYCVLELKEALRLEKRICMFYNTDSIAKMDIGPLLTEAELQGISMEDFPSAMPISTGLSEVSLAVKKVRSLSKPDLSIVTV